MKLFYDNVIHMSEEMRISLRIPEGELAEKLSAHIQTSQISTSNYLRRLIERDLDDKPKSLPTPSNQKALVSLCKNFHPTTVELVEAWCERLDLHQPRFIFGIFESLLESDELDPTHVPSRIKLSVRYQSRSSETGTSQLEAVAEQTPPLQRSQRHPGTGGQAKPKEKRIGRVFQNP